VSNAFPNIPNVPEFLIGNHFPEMILIGRSKKEEVRY
jgi:hypothetical protein